MEERSTVLGFGGEKRVSFVGNLQVEGERDLKAVF